MLTTPTAPPVPATVAKTDLANVFVLAQSSPGAGTNSERWGYGSAAAGDNGTAIGNSASAPDVNGTAIGKSAVAGAYSVSIGSNVGARGKVAIGYSIGGSGNHYVVIGPDHTVNAGYGTVIGAFHTVNYYGCNALGRGVSDNVLTGSWQTAIGHAGTGDVSIGHTLRIFGASSTDASRPLFDFAGTWATATDASRKARVVLNVFDTDSREVMRGEASGSAPMIGFLGASAIARPTVTGSTGGNAALQDLLAKLASLGLITNSTT